MECREIPEILILREYVVKVGRAAAPVADDEKRMLGHLRFPDVRVELQPLLDVEWRHDRAEREVVDEARQIPGAHMELVLHETVEEVRENASWERCVFDKENVAVRLIRVHCLSYIKLCYIKVLRRKKMLQTCGFLLFHFGDGDRTVVEHHPAEFIAVF